MAMLHSQKKNRAVEEMRKCELCKLPARLYCESDQASLCTGCDAKVHQANFIVARHSRTLLCEICQTPTPWVASGARLGNATTKCEKCVVGDPNDELEVSLSLRRTLTPPPPPAASSSDESSSSSTSASSSVCSRRRFQPHVHVPTATRTYSRTRSRHKE